MIINQNKNDEKTTRVLVPEGYRYLLNSISKKISFKKNYTEPVLLCESLQKIKKFLKNLLFIKKNKVIKFLYFFCFFVFLFLLKNNHFLEAKFFAFNFCSKIFGDSIKYSFFKVILSNSYKLDEKSLVNLFKIKFFSFLKNQKISNRLLNFYDQSDLFNIYKNFKTIIYFLNGFIKKKNLIQRFQYGSYFQKNKKNFLKKKKPEKNLIFISSLKNLKFLEFLHIRSKNSKHINCIDFSTDNNTIVLGNQNGLINIYKLRKTSSKKKNFDLKGHQNSVICAKKVNFGNYILSGSSAGELYLWSLNRASLTLKYQTLSNSIWDLSITSDGKKFCSTGSQGFVGLWCIERSFPYRFLNGHRLDVNIVKWHSNSNFLVTGSDDRTIRIWDVRVKNSIGKIISDRPVNGLDFSPCGRRLTVSGKSNYISTFDMRAVKVIFRIKEKYLKNKIDKISYLNNEDFCYVKDHKIIKLWDFGKKSNLLNPLSIKYSSELDKIFQLKIKKYNKLTIIGTNNN